MWLGLSLFVLEGRARVVSDGDAAGERGGRQQARR